MLPLELQKLIDRFTDNYEQYENSSYNETELRREFLDKFIKVLGWDVDNEQGFSETFKEVAHEDKLKIGTQTKAPDYCIQIGGRKLFFIEAKKPSIDIKNDIIPAFQIRRYGWNAKMPFCLLTNFEEFAVYDTSWKPVASDKASIARLLYCKFSELDNPSPYSNLTNWKYIHSIFAKESIQRGSLEKRSKADKKKGTQEVDETFLKDIEEWREKLSNNIILRNKLTERELNAIVQKTIDRIIFLRICEDRGIENENTLKNISTNANAYSDIIKLFKGADEKYNSGLFHFKEEKATQQPPDILSLRIKIDDIVLRKIIQGMYYPAPYQFNIMPADILGSIYERFLGKVIRLTSEHRAKVEYKPEVKKAGGVYYTPSYIVDYIVKNTIGKQLENKSIKTAGDFRILDPACGSGSFLIVAYQYLLDWYLAEYIKLPNNYKKEIIKVSDKNYKLTIKERKRILTSHIFGVDIDSQAVEVSKLSLLLKALEGLTGQEIQQSLFNERVLPNLASNIKCGNSLIGSDFYNQGELKLDSNEQYKINAFDWQTEFKEVFEDGGFDAVIGNPPYVKEYIDRQTFENIKKSYLSKYYQGKMDLWYFFVENGLDLLKNNGFLGFIAPNNWATNEGSLTLRNKILFDSKIEKYIDFGDYKVFKDAGIQTMVFVLNKTFNKKYNLDYYKIINKDVSKAELVEFLTNKKTTQDIKYTSVEINADIMKDNYISFVDNKVDALLNKIKQAGNYYLTDKSTGQGIQGAPDECFIVKSKTGFTKEEQGFIKNFYTTTERYAIPTDKRFIIYITDNNFKEKNLRGLPNLYNHFEQHKQVLKEAKKRFKTPLKPYYYLHRDRDENMFLDGNAKIISVGRTAYPKFMYSTEAFYGSRALFFIRVADIDLKYLTGILNSKLIAFWLYNRGKKQGEQLQVDKKPLMNIPILKTTDVKIENKLVSLVEKMLDIKKKEAELRDEQSKTIYTRQALVIDKEIDALVYSLYGLTGQEIKTIENA